MFNHLKKITGLTIIVILMASLLQSQSSYSLGEESPYKDECKENECCISYHLAVDTAESLWIENVRAITDQEEPASQMVKDGMESLRTFDCLTEYICKAVLYSAIAKPATTNGTGITSAHIDTIPGCQAPEDLTFGSGWDNYIDYLKTGDNDFASLAQNNQLNFVTQCMTDTEGQNNTPNSSQASQLYQDCLNLVETKMGCDLPSEQCTSRSSSFVLLESMLKNEHADQKNRALESKLYEINNRLSGTYTVTNAIQEDLLKLESLFSCTAEQCT